MPKDLLYASFKDAPYTSQFVGSIHPELKEAQQVLNQTYDLSKESDSKLAAVARDMAQKAHPKDTQAAQALFEDYSAKLAERAKAGNYERMLHETTNDARQFNVNASKIVAEKQRIDEALKAIDDNPAYTADDKALRKRMTVAHQSGLTYNKNQGLVEGEGFQADRFAPTFDTPRVLDDITKGFIPDQTATAGGRFIHKKTGDGETRLMFQTNDGTTRFVKEDDVKNFVGDILKIDPKFQDHIDTKTKEALHLIDPNTNWRNPDPKLYNAIKQQVENEEVTTGARAMANKYGFVQKEKSVKFENDPIDIFKKKLKLGSEQVYGENGRQTIPSTTKQEELKDVDLESLTKDRTKSTYGPTSQFRGMTGAPSVDIQGIKGKSISELTQEKDSEGLPKYPGLSNITKIVTKNQGESEQDYAKRVNPTYKSYLSKIKTHQAYQEDLGAESKQYTDVVLGPEIGEGKNKSRTGGGYFTNSPVWIEQNGKFTKYENGIQAINDGAITPEDLSKFSITGINHNYGDFQGAFEGSGQIGDKKAKIFVGGSAEHRKYSEPLFLAENAINTGEAVENMPTQMLTSRGEIPITISVNPLVKDHFSVNSKKEFTNIDPQVTITYQDGYQETMDYKKFKNSMIKANPYKDPILNKQRSNKGTELFKDVLTQDEIQ